MSTNPPKTQPEVLLALDNLVELIDQLYNPNYTRIEIAEALRKVHQDLTRPMWQRIEADLDQIDSMKDNGQMSKTMSFAELMALPPETAEEAYRRGYLDGFIAALERVYAEKEIPPEHWDFWHDTLYNWQKTNPETIVLPPGPLP